MQLDVLHPVSQYDYIIPWLHHHSDITAMVDWVSSTKLLTYIRVKGGEEQGRKKQKKWLRSAGLQYWLSRYNLSKLQVVPGMFFFLLGQEGQNSQYPVSIAPARQTFKTRIKIQMHCTNT